MPTARVARAHWTYSREFDNKIEELKKLSERAASYLLYDPEVKSLYRENIRRATSYLYNEFHKKEAYSNEYLDNRSNIFSALTYLYEGEYAAYQRARRKDWSVYEATAKFENSGIVFYSKETLKLIGGVVQMAGGAYTFKIGRVIKKSGLQGIGMLAMSVGASNFVEHGSSIIYEFTRGEYGAFDNNFLQKVMRDVSVFMGYNPRSGELAYKTVDFGVSMFLTYGALVRLNNPKRILNLPYESKSKLIYPNLVDRAVNPKGNFFLYHALRADFIPKIKKMSQPQFLINAGISGYKAKLLLSEYERN